MEMWRQPWRNSVPTGKTWRVPPVTAVLLAPQHTAQRSGAPHWRLQRRGLPRPETTLALWTTGGKNSAARLQGLRSHRRRSVRRKRQRKLRGRPRGMMRIRRTGCSNKPCQRRWKLLRRPRQRRKILSCWICSCDRPCLKRSWTFKWLSVPAFMRRPMRPTIPAVRVQLWVKKLSRKKKGLAYRPPRNTTCHRSKRSCQRTRSKRRQLRRLYPGLQPHQPRRVSVHRPRRMGCRCDLSPA
mmetsp:Transcript_40964/g.88759  ORF Transcript_40964/g.88759 Transcript_40964/m.88759 type:complete len:240 (+) Transcript_40964:367-1086(+)